MTAAKLLEFLLPTWVGYPQGVDSGTDMPLDFFKLIYPAGLVSQVIVSHVSEISCQLNRT